MKYLIAPLLLLTTITLLTLENIKGNVDLFYPWDTFLVAILTCFIFISTLFYMLGCIGVNVYISTNLEYVTIDQRQQLEDGLKFRYRLFRTLVLLGYTSIPILLLDQDKIVLPIILTPLIIAMWSFNIALENLCSKLKVLLKSAKRDLDTVV